MRKGYSRAGIYIGYERERCWSGEGGLKCLGLRTLWGDGIDIKDIGKEGGGWFGVTY